jgi:hypothetical protein
MISDHHVAKLSRRIVERGHLVELDHVIVGLGRLLRRLLVARGGRLPGVSVIAVGIGSHGGAGGHYGEKRGSPIHLFSPFSTQVEPRDNRRSLMLPKPCPNSISAMPR